VQARACVVGYPEVGEGVGDRFQAGSAGAEVQLPAAATRTDDRMDDAYAADDVALPAGCSEETTFSDDR
jgi:hypothetical protein